ncbi:hypothetical protein FIBSPDRAFT_200003 [Athelia psychrophila]|uniref:Transcription and mRNA export factor SUS1 n=1 Tax=Athelia psychrophila TaxID=1759441 RepID=A0A165ZNF7_9AGAM|nr:hypothetical protein FIBSPDRAFT_200003 [Fibularhizoctonia sp. CBS 109695]
MPAKTASEGLHAQIQRRMVESGEWDRIQLLLSSKLSETGWTDDLSHRSKEQARGMEHLSFSDLLQEFTPQAQNSIPPAVRKEFMGVIRQYIEKQLE